LPPRNISQPKDLFFFGSSGSYIRLSRLPGIWRGAKNKNNMGKRFFPSYLSVMMNHSETALGGC
jgi:hypothetical protein